MTEKVAVVTDSSPYLPSVLIEKYPIHVVPLTVIWGEECLADGVDITPDQFYKRLNGTRVMPSTSQPSVADFLTIYQDLHRQGYHILSVLISAKLSGTVSSATQARDLLPEAKIEIIDSESVAMGCGFQVLAAAEAAHQGASLADCKLEALRARSQAGVIFVLDTLEFLHRGGRIGGAKRFFGTLLQVKPVLAIEQGVVVSVDQVRTHQKALERVVKIIVDQAQGHQILRLATLHANNPEPAQAILQKAESLLSPSMVVHSAVSPVIGTHARPGAVGLAYLMED